MSERAGGVDFFAQGALPAPRVGAREAAQIARARFGIDAGAAPLGSQQDQNFLLRGDDGEPRGVLKLANRAVGLPEIEAQALAAETLAQRLPEVRVATTLADRDGARMLARVETSEGPLVAHVVRYLPGRTLERSGYLSPRVIAACGRLGGQVGAALEDFAHAGLERVLQWDLRNAERVIEALAGHVPEPALQARLRASSEQAWRLVAGLADALPVQPGHFDLTDENLLTLGAGGIPAPDGLIDLGDLSRSWRVAELAITITSILHHPGVEPHALLPAIRAFHELRRLSPEEVAALWPLVVLRSAVLTVSSSQQIALDGEQTHAFTGVVREREAFERASAVPVPVMTGLVRDALGLEQRPPRLPPA
ncbi:MAG: phosphotransferase, partial [Acidobacteriota bacterium]|nr:phosphotransferase [Acidobacteriota bacterium]